MKNETAIGITLGFLLVKLFAGRGAAIGKIYPSAPPGRSECLDGKFSDRSGPGTCSYHGGLMLKTKRSQKQELPPIPEPQSQHKRTIDRGFHVRDTLVSPAVFNQLPEENKRQILRLYSEYQRIPYIDVRSHMGPSQWARASKRQKEDIQKAQLKVFRIEEQVQELLKLPEQVEKERNQREQEAKRTQLQRLNVEKDWYERLYSHHLKSNRDNKYKQRYRQILQEIDNIQ